MREHGNILMEPSVPNTNTDETARLLGELDDVRALVVGDLNSAMSRLDAIREQADAAGAPAVLARWHSVRGHALNYASEYAEAAEHAKTAAALAEKLGNPAEAARARMVHVHASAKLGDLPGALEHAHAAERGFLEAGENALASQALCNRAIVTRMTGDAAGATVMFERALGMDDHPPATAAQIESGLAEAFLDAGRYEEGEAAFRRSAETFEAAGISRAAAIVRGSLADLYGRQGRLSEAIEQFEHARRFFESDRAHGELGRILTEQADVYAATGLDDEAVSGYRRAVALLEESGAVQEKARAFAGLGEVLLTSDPEAAVGSLREAARLAGEAGNEAQRASAEILLAIASSRSGDHETALGLLDSAADALKSRQSDLVRCEIARAAVESAMGRTEDAVRRLDAVMDRSLALGLPLSSVQALRARAEAHRGAGDLEAAIRDVNRAIDDLERIRVGLQGARFRSGLLGGTKEIFELGVSLSVEQGDDRGAFATTERARSRTLLDAVVPAAIDAPDQPDSSDDLGDRALIDELIRARADLAAAYASHDPTAGGTDQAEWTARIRSADERISTLETRLASTSGGREILGVPESPDRICGALDQNEGLVSFWRDRSGLHAFVARPDGVRHRLVSDEPDRIDAAFEDLMFQVRRAVLRGSAGGERRRRAFDDAAKRMGDLVWSPIAEELGDCGSVIVVPTRPLHALPMTALRSGDGYLCERHRISLLPSASLLPVLRERPETTNARIAVLAAPDERAPQITSEARAIGDVHPSAIIDAEGSATADRARALASDCGVLHLACHGAFPPGNPHAAGLRLADRWVTVRDVLSWRMSGGTVLLSGCDTGRQAVEAGEELVGFARAFFSAGARGVVTSLWLAHDEATTDLMTSLYRTIPEADGSPDIAGALQSAQQSQISSGVHPALWANFAYMGV